MMPNLLIATSSAPIAGFTCVLPLLAHHLTEQPGSSSAIVDIGIEIGPIGQYFEHHDRLQLTTPVSVAPEILRAHAACDVVMFDAKHYNDDNVFRLSLLTHAARAEIDRQRRRAIALVPFERGNVAAEQSAYAHATMLRHEGYDVRFVFSSLTKHDYIASVRGHDMIHGSIPPLGSGLVELITREKCTLGSLLADPPTNFGQAIEHIRDWLSRCRQSSAFLDLINHRSTDLVDAIPGTEPAPLRVPRIHLYWMVDSLDEAIDGNIESLDYRSWARRSLIRT